MYHSLDKAFYWTHNFLCKHRSHREYFAKKTHVKFLTSQAVAFFTVNISARVYSDNFLWAPNL